MGRRPDRVFGVLMITVAILINGHPLTARSATRVMEGVYHCDDGKIIKHNYGDGAVKLAIKMLEGLEESRAKGKDLSPPASSARRTRGSHKPEPQDAPALSEPAAQLSDR